MLSDATALKVVGPIGDKVAASAYLDAANVTLGAGPRRMALFIPSAITTGVARLIDGVFRRGWLGEQVTTSVIVTLAGNEGGGRSESRLPPRRRGGRVIGGQ